MAAFCSCSSFPVHLHLWRAPASETCTSEAHLCAAPLLEICSTHPSCRDRSPDLAYINQPSRTLPSLQTSSLLPKIDDRRVYGDTKEYYARWMCLFLFTDTVSPSSLQICNVRQAQAWTPKSLSDLCDVLRSLLCCGALSKRLQFPLHARLLNSLQRKQNDDRGGI
jgi:hypothetical protein